MSEPVVLLNRDRRLDQLSLQDKVSSVQKSLHIGLARDAKVDRLALDYYSSLAGSRFAPPGKIGSRRRSRKRRALVHAFSQVGYEKPAISDRKTLTTASPYYPGRNEQAAALDTRSIQTLTNASSQSGSEQTAKLGTGLLIMNDGSNQDGSEKPSAEMKRPSDDDFEQGDCKKPSTLDKRSVRTLIGASKQDGIVQVAALDRPNGQSLAASPDQGGSEPAALSNGPSCSSDSKCKGITKEDFMALLCLCPTDEAARVRTCNRNRTSKYLYVKSRNRWRKICGELNDRCSGRDTKTVQRPSYVLLERSNFIDRLALQPIQQSIHLKSPKRNAKTACHRKWSVGLCRRKPEVLNVVLKRDSGLDRLAVQNPNVVCTSSSDSPETVIAPTEAKLTSTAPLSADTTASRASEKPRCKRPSVQIRRDSGLDMLALQTSSSVCEPPSNSAGVSIVSSCEPKLASMVPVSTYTIISHVLENPGLKNLSVKINREPCIDQLAVENSRASVIDSGSDCNNTTIPYHQPASKLPLESATSISSRTKFPGGDVENLMNRYCKSTLGVFPNLSVHNDSTLTSPGRYVIKLRKISSVDWSIIQPDGQGLEAQAYDQLNRDACGGLFNPQSSSSVGSGSKRDTTESTGSKSVCLRAGLSCSNSGGSEGGFYHKTQSHDTQSSAAQPYLPASLRLSSRQSTFEAEPVVGSSATKSSEEMPRTVSSVSYSKSSRRTKSVYSMEESPLELHYNENRNPQSHVITPVKTVVMGGNHSSDAIVKSRILRKHSKPVQENDPQKELQVARLRGHQNNNDYNHENPFIPCCMPFKKPLGVRSEFYSTFNMNQTASNPNSERDTVD